MRKKFLVKIALFGLTALLFISCDKDFNEVGADIVGNTHFGYEKYTNASIKAYNQKTGVIASNNLPTNPLGFYDNPVFGKTQANFVTQVEMAVPKPTFNNAVLDSVILDIPYFIKNNKTILNSDGSRTYELDSIFGNKDSKFKLSVYQSNYLLRDLDPMNSTDPRKVFYTNQDSDIDNNKVGMRLNNSNNPAENDQFGFSDSEVITKTMNDKGEDVIGRKAPSMRLHLSVDAFTNIILNAPEGQLDNNSVFIHYFRGLYFKVEDGNPGHMAMLNFKGGKITMYYKEDNSSTSSTDKISKTFAMNLTGNTVSLLTNSNENAEYLNAINNPSEEADKLYLKGGEGSVAVIDILNSDEITDLKNSGWMINEASLTFYVDKDVMNNSQTKEPNRILLYDWNNNKMLADYDLDITTNTYNSKFNKYVYGGILQKEEVENGRGIKYKIRITKHIANLINKEATNVRLGLCVTENIANPGFSKIMNEEISKIPTMSVMSQLGTILYGTSSVVPEDKRLKLEIYYTKPN